MESCPARKVPARPRIAACRAGQRGGFVVVGVVGRDRAAAAVSAARRRAFRTPTPIASTITTPKTMRMVSIPMMKWRGARQRFSCFGERSFGEAGVSGSPRRASSLASSEAEGGCAAGAPGPAPGNWAEGCGCVAVAGCGRDDDGRDCWVGFFMRRRIECFRFSSDARTLVRPAPARHGAVCPAVPRNVCRRPRLRARTLRAGDGRSLRRIPPPWPFPGPIAWGEYPAHISERFPAAGV